jgi:hypothetical protein
MKKENVLKNIIIKTKSKIEIVSLILGLLSVFMHGIKVNTQEVSPLNKLSGGFPFTWFEYYYENINLNLSFIMNNFWNHYKIDLFILFIDILFFYHLIKTLIRCVKYCHKKLKNKNEALPLS